MVAVAGGGTSSILKTSDRPPVEGTVEFGSHQERALSSALMEEHALIASAAGKVELLSQVLIDGRGRA